MYRPAISQTNSAQREISRRRAYVVMTSLAALIHAVGMAHFWLTHDLLQTGGSIFGLALCLLMAWIACSQNGQLAWVEKLALLLGSFWFLLDLGQEYFSGQPISLYVLFDLAIVAVLVFTWAPLWRAITITVGFLILTGAALLFSGGEWAALLPISMLLMLIGFMSVFNRQLSVERARTEWLHQLAFHDPLTGIASRRMAEDELAKITHGTLFLAGDAAVVMFDVDHFKVINDTWGHLEGDRVLQQVAQALTQNVRQGDLVCRWGGEEFLVILYNVTLIQAQERVEQIRQAVGMSIAVSPLTISAGGALISEGQDARNVLALADQRLYAAKASGRDRAVWTGQPTATSPLPGQ